MTRSRIARITRSCAVLALLLCARSASAEHFEIDLSIDTGKEKIRSSADTYPPAEGHHPRPVCHAKKGEPLTFQFFLTSNFPHDTIKGVIVRYFIRPQRKVGQSEIPDASDDSVTEGRIVMDFKPNTGRVGIRQPVHVDKPGAYLVRVETANSDSDHEHFSAIDLVVE